MNSPAHVMPLLESVRTEKTSAQVILDLMTVGKIIKKVPVVVGNCAGFAVNRTFFPYSQGAHLLVNLGVDVFRIDRAISSFGLPMGPFQYSSFLNIILCVILFHIYNVHVVIMLAVLYSSFSLGLGLGWGWGGLVGEIP